MARGKITHNVVAAIGEYKDGQGNTKKQWQKCGIAFTQDSGDIYVKLYAFPVAKDWDNYLSLFLRDENAVRGEFGSSICSHDLLATIGEYRGENNVKKKHQIKIGVAFTRSDGSISLKIDAIPLAVDWSRFISLIPREASTVEARADSAPKMEDDDIPF